MKENYIMENALTEYITCRKLVIYMWMQLRYETL